MQNWIRISLVLASSIILKESLHSQRPGYWQQEADYTMQIDMDVVKNQYKGLQTIHYKNNSPDTLTHLFYHLYFNAFQPGSMMDMRSRTLPDPDSRVGDRIAKLGPEEIGYQRIESIKVNGEVQSFVTEGTILEVKLAKPLLPGSSSKLEMVWDAQVPLQIRRSGRDNAEGIRFSMSQWYPKLCEYDPMGWHANPYVGREFYGIWGDFDVKITLDKSYIIGGTGVLQNADEIGYGYSRKQVDHRKAKTLTWHFKAENVHDFVWAADPDYVHTTYETDEGVMLHMFYQPGEKTTENWTQLPSIMDKALDFMNAQYGKYPYPSYAFIQGGDGGMEYPMATLITGERNLSSLVGVSIHEWMHSWYQMVLGTNEALYPYMDEGFTSFGTAETMNYLRSIQAIPGEAVDNPNLNAVRGYANFAMTGYEEPLITHADHYNTNQAYGVASYVKGAAMLEQLKYIIGDERMYEGLRRYYNTWKFKHPHLEDFIRIMEKTSDLELDWFKEYYVHSTHVIDYAVDTIMSNNENSIIQLSRQGGFPMPQEVEITFTNGQKTLYYIPLRLMRGEKSITMPAEVEKVYQAYDWPWTHPIYLLEIDVPMSNIASVKLNPTGQMADVDADNNVWPRVPEMIE